MDWLDFGDALASIDEGFGWFLLAIALIAATLVAIFLVVPLSIFVVEVVVVVVAVLVAFVLRIVFRQPWLVDAVNRDERSGAELVWAVPGLKRAAQTLEEVAVQLQAGTATPVVTAGELVASRSLESGDVASSSGTTPGQER